MVDAKLLLENPEGLSSIPKAKIDFCNIQWCLSRTQNSACKLGDKNSDHKYATKIGVANLETSAHASEACSNSPSPLLGGTCVKVNMDPKV